MNIKYARLPALVAFGLAAPLCAAAAGPAQTELTLSVTGHAESAPDLTIATLSVQHQDATAAIAQSAVNQAMRAALAAAKTIAGVRATTGGYSVYPGDPKRQTWHAQQTLVLRLAAPPDSAPAQKLRRLIGTLQARGVLLDDISGSLSTKAARRTRAQAIADAVAQMRAEAAATAAALGVKVAAVTKMTLGSQTPFHPPFPMMMASRMASAAPPQAQPGPIDERVSLSATIRLAAPPGGAAR